MLSRDLLDDSPEELDSSKWMLNDTEEHEG